MPHVCPQRLKEGVGNPGNRATGVCEPPDVDAENQTQDLRRVLNC